MVATLESVDEATKWLPSNTAPDVIFSDIELADGQAFEIYRHIPPPCPVVFVTAYDEHALAAFRHNAIDYLLKPVREEELRRAVAKLRERSLRVPDLATLREAPARPESHRRSFLFPFRGGLIPVRTEDIAYFYTEDEVVFAQPAGDERRRYATGETLEILEGQLDPDRFFRANRQYIVHRPAVRRLKPLGGGRFALTVEPARREAIVISKARAPELRNWLER